MFLLSIHIVINLSFGRIKTRLKSDFEQFFFRRSACRLKSKFLLSREPINQFGFFSC
jgi:hypothetical protein